MCRVYNFKCRCSEGFEASLEWLGFRTTKSIVVVSCHDKHQTHIQGHTIVEPKISGCRLTSAVTIIQGDFCSNCLFARVTTRHPHLPDRNMVSMGKLVARQIRYRDPDLWGTFKNFRNVPEQSVHRISNPDTRADFDYVLTAIETLVKYIHWKKSAACQTGKSYGYKGEEKTEYLWRNLSMIQQLNMAADADNEADCGMQLRSLHFTPLHVSKVPEKDCSICQEEMGTDGTKEGNLETPVKTPCGHIFGQDCIHDWVVKNKKLSCPMCRARFYPSNHQSREENKSYPAWLSRLMTDLGPRPKREE